MNKTPINRRHFIKGSTALLALSAFGAHGMDWMDRKEPYRVALIGTGWYGKSDLFRLIQVLVVKTPKSLESLNVSAS